MKYLQLAARILVGGILIYAGFMKAVGPSAEFAAAIAAYKLVPPNLLSPIAYGLPYVEMWIGLFVLAGFYTREAAVAAAVLFVTFLGVLLSTFLRGIDLASCGCFGADSLPPRYTVILDIVLLACSVATYRQSKLPPSYSLDRLIP